MYPSAFQSSTHPPLPWQSLQVKAALAGRIEWLMLKLMSAVISVAWLYTLRISSIVTVRSPFVLVVPSSAIDPPEERRRPGG